MNVASITLPKIPKFEIEPVLSQLNSRKAPGSDGILNEMLKKRKEDIMSVMDEALQSMPT